MDLTLSDEQRLLRESADRFVAETFTSEHRKKAVNDPLGYSPDIWKQFAARPMAGSAAARSRSGC